MTFLLILLVVYAITLFFIVGFVRVGKGPLALGVNPNRKDSAS